MARDVFGERLEAGVPIGIVLEDARKCVVDLEREVGLLRRAVVQYGDRASMSSAADMALQQAIDRAFENAPAR